MTVWSKTVGLVERSKQFFVETPADTATRQLSNITHGLAAKMRKGRLMRPRRSQRLHRQPVEQLVQRPAYAVLDASARERERAQARRCPGNADGAEFRSLDDHTVSQRPLPAKKARTCLHFHDDGFIDDGNARGELQRPRCQSPELVISGLQRLRVRREKECGPQHRWAPLEAIDWVSSGAG
ncbi:hypothetical protein QTI66_00145 [Variovorax sp. J22R133]|uniref:hypothetical protein n=1 Tax=Variovorax brevis TaxID=3053503 RepID=UPI002575D322|nr:hypothetical protein [Variovorax sp. J22R133]MDM0110537.1 hypothetical protein [Variovorax sp. J22R133]